MAVSRFLHDAGANIVQSDQYSSDPARGTFFLRMEFAGSEAKVGSLAERFGVIAERFGMTWRLGNPDRPKRLAILVSKQDHCLQDLLYRWKRNELEAEVVLVASNHPDHREAVEDCGIPFHHIPIPPPRTRPRRRVSCSSFSTARATLSCWRATCRFSRGSSSIVLVCR